MKKKEKKYGLLKGVVILVLITLILSWVIPSGEFAASGFASDGVPTRIGLNNLVWLIYYGLYFSIDKIIMLLVIGGLYGVLGKIKGYNKLVTNIASKLKKHKKVTVILFSIIIAALTSVLTQTFVVIIFIPFIVAILKRMNLDKLTILATTFGSIMVGVLGATYGTEGLLYLSEYMITGEQTVGDVIHMGLLVRAGILAIGLVLFNFFTIVHMDKVKNKEESAEMFEIEETEDTKKAYRIPIIILGIITFVIVILAFINWNNNFGLTIFEDFHDEVFNIKLGKDFYIFKDLLGANMDALGAWDLFSITGLILLFTGILAICYRVKFDELVEGYINGIKKMLKPIACVFGAFTLLVVVYMSPYVATIINKLFTLTDGFNLATMSLSALLSNILHTDLGYTGYVLGSYLTTEYIDYINPIYIIFTSLYGFVQFFIPTSIILGIGLTSLNVKYTDWLKHIWKFLVGMLICLLIIFILITIL